MLVVNSIMCYLSAQARSERKNANIEVSILNSILFLNLNEKNRENGKIA